MPNDDRTARKQKRTKKRPNVTAPKRVENYKPSAGKREAQNRHETPPPSRFQPSSLTDWIGMGIQLLILGVLLVGTWAAVENIDLLRNSVDEARRSADAATIAANAARQSNKLAERSIDNNIEASRLEQRAWVAQTAITGVPNAPTVGQPLRIEVTIQNTGRTPARNVQGYVLVEPVSAAERPNLDYAGMERIELGTMQPNMDYLATLEPIRSRSGMQNVVVTPQVLAQLIDGNTRLWVHGRFTYDDTFGAGHWFQFCLSWRPPEFTYWDAHPECNDADE